MPVDFQQMASGGQVARLSEIVAATVQARADAKALRDGAKEALSAAEANDGINPDAVVIVAKLQESGRASGPVHAMATARLYAEMLGIAWPEAAEKTEKKPRGRRRGTDND